MVFMSSSKRTSNSLFSSRRITWSAGNRGSRSSGRPYSTRRRRAALTTVFILGPRVQPRPHRLAFVALPTAESSLSMSARNFLSWSLLIGALSSRSRNTHAIITRSPSMPLSRGIRGLGRFVSAQ